VVGTHTHAPTADHQILPRGTAFMSDVGMTGDYDSVIGMDKDEPLNRFTRRIGAGRFEPALGRRRSADVAVETDDATGLRAASARCGSAAGWRRHGRRSGEEWRHKRMIALTSARARELLRPTWEERSCSVALHR
jgi:hypothetical protein